MDDNNDTFNDMLSIDLSNSRGQITAMSISPANRDIVLGSKEGLLIVDLQNPYDIPRLIQSTSKFELADIQWSPWPSKSEWIASASNQKASVYNLMLAGRNGVSPIEHELKGHARAITDINWASSDPSLLATCSLDSWIWAWDLRGARGGIKPVFGFSDFGNGATQVKWNRVKPNIIASSHDDRVLIWDNRVRFSSSFVVLAS